MIRQLIFGLLLFLAIACKKEQDSVSSNQPANEETTATTIQAKSMQRLVPNEAMEASATGPAASSEGVKTNQLAAAAAQINFEPNAGAIWRDPSTGKTHLLALQLPGTPGKQVKWQSMGTGWEGTTALTMDKLHFYAVWKNEVYRVPKKTPNVWSKIIPNNGEYITGIEGGYYGMTFIRGNKLYDFNQNWGVSYIPTHPDALPGATLMTGYTGKYQLHFKNSKREIWAFSNWEGNDFTWKKLHTYTPDKFFQSMAANPMTKMLYLSDGISLREIHQINESGVRSVFSYHPFSWEAKLVVNNGYVWIMGESLHQLMTLGSQKGKSAYNESGWKGLTKVCADPDLVLN